MKKKVSKDYLIFITTLTVLCLACFIAFSMLIVDEYTFKMDCFNGFIAKNRNDGLTSFFKVFTHLGSFYTLAVLAIAGLSVLYFVLKKKRFAVFSAVGFALVCLENYFTKQIVQRARPEKYMIIAETGFSFPSGHAMMTFAFFALAIYCVFKFLKNKPLKISLIALFVTLIVSISFSRIYLGVHYLSDILAGWMLTFVIIVLVVALYKSNLFKFLKDEDKKQVKTNKNIQSDNVSKD